MQEKVTMNNEESNLLTDLTEAVRISDLAAVKTALAQLSTFRVRQELDRVIDGENLISLALRLGCRVIATELLIRSIFEVDQWSWSYEEFSWRNLFEFIDNTLSINQMKEKLKYARPFAMNGDLSLESIVSAKLKYLKVAIELGAHSQDGKNLGKMILTAKRHPGFDPKEMQRFEYLVKSKACKRFPLSVQETLKHLRDYSSSIHWIKYLECYPEWFLEQDENGNNILLYALQKGNQQIFSRIWSKIAKYGTDKLIEVALQANAAGKILAVEYLKRPCERYPMEFSLALKRLIESGKTEQLRDLFTHHREAMAQNTKELTLIYVYLIECGYDFEPLQRLLYNMTGLQDLSFAFQHRFHFKKKQPKKDTATAVAEVRPDFKLPLLAFPNELLFHVIENLQPRDVVTLSWCNKKLKVLVASFLDVSTETCFREYYKSHLFPVKELQTSYKAHVRDHFKLRSTWCKNKYSTITLPRYGTLAMDENWLVLSSTDQKLSYWNCHTQELIQTSVLSHPGRHLLLNNYNRESMPTILDQRNWKIIRGEQVINMTVDPNMGFNFFSTVKPIDHRILVNENIQQKNRLYNVETGDIERIFHDTTPQLEYNPFNGCFIGTNIRQKVILIDPRSKEAPVKVLGDSMLMHCIKIATEHTIFFTGSTPSVTRYERLFSAGFVDLRKSTSDPIYMIQNWPQTNLNDIYSKERLVFSQPRTSILGSWHLPSQKIEWMELTKEPAIQANARYMVLNSSSGQNVLIRDYLS